MILSTTRLSHRISLLLATTVLAGCANIGGGASISIPIYRGISIGVGAGTGGINVGVSAGAGPVSAGVGINQKGQVTGGAGVGVGTQVGGATVGVGVGTGGVLYDPNAPSHRPADNNPK